MKFLFSVLMTMFSFVLMAQSPFAIQNSKGQGDASVEQISLANPWFGAKLSYNLNDENPLEDNFLFNAKVLYTPVSGEKFAIPIVGSAGLGDDNLLNPESGLNIGIYPYYFLNRSSSFQIVAHGGVGYKVIAAGVEAGADVPQQIRLMGGLEAAFFPEDGGAPTTLSITPAYLYNTLESTDNTGVLEIDGIIPISPGLGIIASGQIPLNKQFDGSFKFGVIINGQL